MNQVNEKKPKTEQAVAMGVVERPPDSGKLYVKIKQNYTRRYYKVRTVGQGKALYTRLKAEILEGRYQPKKQEPLKIKEWINRCLEGSTNRDRLQERQRAIYWIEVLGNRNLSAISNEDLRHHQAVMLAKRNEKGQPQWSPATVNRYFSALRRILTLATQDGKLDRSPMRGIKFLPEPIKDRFFTDEELGKIKTFMTKQEWNQIAFALGTCLRLSEQFCLRWDLVNFEDSVLSLPLPKGNKTRRVPLSEEAKTILRKEFSDSPWVFPDPMNPLTPLGRHAPSKAFKKVLKRLGIKNASWHTLRHTGASRLLRAGVDIFTVSKILGHSTIQTTMRYLHLVKDQLHDAVNKVSLDSLGGEVEINDHEELGATKRATNE